MATSTVIKNFTDGAIVLSDGGSATLTVPACLGDMQVSGLSRKLRVLKKYESRGNLVSARHGERTYPTISFATMFSHFTSASATSVADFVLKQGNYSANVSTFGANADVYAVKLTYTAEGTDFGDGGDHQAIFTDIYFTLDFAEGDPSQWTLNGEILGDVTGDLSVAIP